MKGLLVVCLAAAWPAAAAERYSVSDQGVFAETGRHVEFSDRFGWESYEVRFDFGFDEGVRRITPDSTLTLTVSRRQGGTWSYKCRHGRERISTNINFLYGKGVSILAECRIKPSAFSSAVGLPEDLVGEPTLVFQALIKDGKAVPGLHKGLYILSAAQVEAGEMGPYATRSPDPSDLSVLFASERLYPRQPSVYQPTPRFIP